ncbi:MAG: class I SAM-dependent methyltransferase [Polyangiales bacterium]
MRESARRLARECKGFLDEAEGLRLYELAKAQATLGPVLEIGSYCGKSSVYLGSGAKDGGGTLICVDHHRGSEEHQPGEEYHDPTLFDADAQRMDSLHELRRTLRRAELEDTAVLLVARSQNAARIWSTPLGMVFIDGGHSQAQADADYEGWAHRVTPGGVLAIHDLFPNPNEGGQAPINIYRRALASGLFAPLPTTKTLGVLRRV